MIDLPPCLDEIAAYYEVPAIVIKGIAQAENGPPHGMIGPNRNGTYDLGRMQINTVWLDTLKLYDIQMTDLLTNTCTNIAVGTFVLKMEYNRFNDWCNAFAAYNAGPTNLEAGRAYAQRVSKIIRRLGETNANNPVINC